MSNIIATNNTTNYQYNIDTDGDDVYDILGFTVNFVEFKIVDVRVVDNAPVTPTASARKAVTTSQSLEVEYSLPVDEVTCKLNDEFIDVTVNENIVTIPFTDIINYDVVSSISLTAKAKANDIVLISSGDDLDADYYYSAQTNSIVSSNVEFVTTGTGNSAVRTNEIVLGNKVVLTFATEFPAGATGFVTENSKTIPWKSDTADLTDDATVSVSGKEVTITGFDTKDTYVFDLYIKNGDTTVYSTNNYAFALNNAYEQNLAITSRSETDNSISITVVVPTAGNISFTTEDEFQKSVNTPIRVVCDKEWPDVEGYKWNALLLTEYDTNIELTLDQVKDYEADTIIPSSDPVKDSTNSKIITLTPNGAYPYNGATVVIFDENGNYVASKAYSVGSDYTELISATNTLNVTVDATAKTIVINSPDYHDVYSSTNAYEIGCRKITIRGNLISDWDQLIPDISASESAIKTDKKTAAVNFTVPTGLVSGDKYDILVYGTENNIAKAYCIRLTVE